jgi:hypothetical protein
MPPKLTIAEPKGKPKVPPKTLPSVGDIKKDMKKQLNKKISPGKDVPEKGGTKSSPKAEAKSLLESPKKPPLTPPKKPDADALNSKSNNSSKSSPTKKLPTPVNSALNACKVAIAKPSDTNAKPRVSTKAPKKLDPSLKKKREAKASAKDSLIVEIRKSQLSQDDDQETILGKRKLDLSEH